MLVIRSIKSSFTVAFTAFLLACTTAAFAQNADMPGAPEQLIGNWGKNSDQCRSHHRKVDDITTITKDTWTDCAGTACEATIQSHRKLKDGFQLKYVSENNPRGWSDRIRLVGADKMEVLPKSKSDKTESYIRCKEADAIAGIGLDKNYSESSQEENEAFAGFYAQAVPTVCPQIAVDKGTVGAMTKARGDLQPEGLKSIQTEAEYAAREDAKERLSAPKF